MSYPPAAEHPLCVELALMARRTDQDHVLKDRFVTFRKDIISAISRHSPGLILRTIRDEIDRLMETVMTESRQWRETGLWPDHKRHLQAMRAASAMHLFLSQTGLKIAQEFEDDNPDVRHFGK